jgi:hypothetical protein
LPVSNPLAPLLFRLRHAAQSRPLSNLKKERGSRCGYDVGFLLFAELRSAPAVITCGLTGYAQKATSIVGGDSRKCQPATLAHLLTLGPS